MKRILAVAVATAFATLAVPALAQDLPKETPSPAMSIDPAKPFGDIDISVAGNDEASRSAFVEGLTEEQRNELKDRCIAIGQDGLNTYPDDVRSFCQTIDTYFQEDIQ